MVQHGLSFLGAPEGMGIRMTRSREVALGPPDARASQLFVLSHGFRHPPLGANKDTYIQDAFQDAFRKDSALGSLVKVGYWNLT